METFHQPLVEALISTTLLIQSDRQQLSLGLKEASKILLAAGATKVIIPTRNPITLNSFREIEGADLSVLNWDLDMVAVQIRMGSLSMGGTTTIKHRPLTTSPSLPPSR